MFERHQSDGKHQGDIISLQTSQHLWLLSGPSSPTGQTGQSHSLSSAISSSPRCFFCCLLCHLHAALSKVEVLEKDFPLKNLEFEVGDNERYKDNKENLHFGKSGNLFCHWSLR